MGLFDAFSGRAGRLSAITGANLAQSRGEASAGAVGSGLDASRNAYNQAYNTGTGAIQQGYGQAQSSLRDAYGMGAAATREGYGGAIGAAGAGFDAASGYLGGGYGQARGDVTAGSNQAMDIYGQGGQAASNYIGTGQGQQLGAINQGYGQGLGTLGGISATFNPYSQPGAVAQTTLAGALGLGSAADQAAARSRFQAAPGYQYQVDQALDQTNRAAAASGGTGSGNTLTALQNRASNLADQGWNSWLSNLSGVGQTGLQAAGQQAGAQTNLAGQQIAQGRDQSQIYGTTAAQQAAIAQATAAQRGQLAYNTGQTLGGQDIGLGTAQATNATNRGTTLAGYNIGQGNALTGLASQYGTNEANLYTGLGNQQAGLAQTLGSQTGAANQWAGNQYVNINNAQTQQQLPLINQGSLAGQQASASALNFGLGLGGTALGIAGLGVPGGGTLGGSLFSGLGSLYGSGAGSGSQWGTQPNYSGAGFGGSTTATGVNPFYGAIGVGRLS